MVDWALAPASALKGKATTYSRNNDAMLFRTMEEMISFTPSFTFRKAGMSPYMPPARMAARITTTGWMTGGRWRDDPSHAAAMAPKMNCPSWAMQNTPTRKAIVAARPVRISGVALERVMNSGHTFPVTPNPLEKSTEKVSRGETPVRAMNRDDTKTPAGWRLRESVW